MVYNYSKLRGKIREYGNQEDVAKAIGRNNTTLNLKLNNKGTFDQTEMVNLCELLGIEIEKLHEYFFNINICK